MIEAENTGARRGRGRGRGTSGAAKRGEQLAIGAGTDAGEASNGEAGQPDGASTAAGTGAAAGETPQGAGGAPAPEGADNAPESGNTGGNAGGNAPAQHSVGYGAMSAGGAPPSGAAGYGGYDDYDVGYDGEFAGGYAGGYGRGGYGRGGYGRGYNGGASAGGGQSAGSYRGTQGGQKQFPSQYQVKEIGSRGIPVPPTYDEAQALLDSFEPTPAQQKRLDELGLVATTRGEAKQVIADYVAQNPDITKQWEAENAAAAVARRQERRGGQDPRVTTPGMFKLLADAGVTEIPSDHATAAAMIDQLAPSENMARVLREHGRAVPETRAEATEIIRGLPATPDQVRTIMGRTRGRWAPRTRGEAERWFQDNPLPANGGGYGQMRAAA